MFQSVRVTAKMMNFGFFLIYFLHAAVLSQRLENYSYGTIRSVPFRLKKDPWISPVDGVLITGDTPVYEAKRGLNDTDFRQFGNAVEHIVQHSRELNAASVDAIDFGSPTPYNRQSPVEKEFPDIVYPEIFVVVAHDLYEKFNFDIWQALPYVLAFWNGVDTRFRGIDYPKYRLNIAGIIFESEKGILRYTAHYPTSFSYNHQTMWEQAKTFWFQHRKIISLDSYDVIVTMTAEDVCGEYDEYGRCRQRIVGNATPGGVCQDNFHLQQTEKIVIVQDNGGFSGIYPTVHELGHIFGAFDDGFYTARNNARCGPEGYIMNGFTDTQGRIFSWSECSLERFENILVKNNATCLYNRPKVSGAYIPRHLPGRLYNADVQCQREGAITNCEIQHNSICRQLTCELTSGVCSTISRPAADGTACDIKDPSKFCLHGECISSRQIV